RFSRDWSSDVCSSDLLLEVQPEENGTRARYSTKEMVEIEHTLVSRASQMRGTQSHGVDAENVLAAFAKQDNAIKTGVAASLHQRSEERRVGKACRRKY